MAGGTLIGADGRPLSAEVLERLLASSQDVLYAVALDPVHMLYATPAFARRMGLPADFLTRGYPFGEYLESVHPEDRARVDAIMAAIVTSRADAELPDNPARYRLRRPEGGWRAIADHYSVLRGPNGAPHTLIGNARDVSERDEALKALAANEERFRSLAENSRDVFFSFRLPEGRYEYVSARVADVLGHTPQDFYDDPGLFLRCVAPDWRETMAAWNEEIARGQVRGSYEFQVLDAQGRLRWLIERLVLVPAPDGVGMLLQGVAADITDERAAREALRASERRFSELIRYSSDSITILDESGLQVFASEAAERMLGFSPAELMGIPVITEMIHPDDQAAAAATFQRVIREGMAGVQYRHRHKDGSWIFVEAWGTNQLDNPDIRGVVVNARDITERKLAEAALRDTNARYSLLAENVVDVIWTTDAALRWTYVSPSVEKLSGHPVARFMATPIDQLFTPESLHKMGALMDRRRTAATPEELAEAYRVEVELRHADGSLVPLEVLVRSMRGPDGGIIGYCGTSRDITERRRAEAALRRSEERYALALKGANDGLWDWDLDQDKVYYSDRWKEIIGYAPEEIRHEVSEWLARIHPEDYKRVLAANRECIEGQKPVFQVEYRLRHKDGSYRWIYGRGASLADDTGRIVRLAGAHTDITARKQAEEALYKSERLSRKLLESMHEGIWAVDANRRTTFVNDRLCAMLGYASAELMNMSPTDVLEWPQRQVAQNQVPDFEAGFSRATDYVLIRKDGTRFPAHVVSSPVMESQGRFEGLVCGVVDLTERARMEHELRRNQARFEALYELSRLTPATEHQMAAFTLREAIRLTDSAAGVLFFVSEDGQQLVPKAWETGDFIAPGLVPSFPADGPLPWTTVLQSGLPLVVNDFQSSGYRVPPGHPEVARFLGVPALDGARPVAVLGLAGKTEPYVQEDTLQITLLLDGMWRVVRARCDDERIRASLREKEALLHEVHHRVKNNLQVISSLMDMAGRRMASDEARLSLRELRGKVLAMSLIHAQLHGAGSGGGISLERFVRALFNQLREVYAGGLELSLRLKLGELDLSLDQAVPLGLALNETLTNIFKHACAPGEEGSRRASRVEIRAGLDEGGRVRIEVEDDGPGLPEVVQPDEAESLGLKLMRGLVRHQLRGELTFADARPGVCVGICFQPRVRVDKS